MGSANMGGINIHDLLIFRLLGRDIQHGCHLLKEGYSIMLLSLDKHTHYKKTLWYY